MPKLHIDTRLSQIYASHTHAHTHIHTHTHTYTHTHTHAHTHTQVNNAEMYIIYRYVLTQGTYAYIHYNLQSSVFDS